MNQMELDPEEKQRVQGQQRQLAQLQHQLGDWRTKIPPY